MLGQSGKDLCTGQGGVRIHSAVEQHQFPPHAKELLCSVQKCWEKWGTILRKQIEDEKYGTMDPKKGKDETENVDNMHELE